MMFSGMGIAKIHATTTIAESRDDHFHATARGAYAGGLACSLCGAHHAVSSTVAAAADAVVQKLGKIKSVNETHSRRSQDPRYVPIYP